MSGKAAHRIDDLNDGQGKITSTPQSDTTVNGKLLSVDGAMGTSHPTGSQHSQGVWKTANGSSAFFVGGKPVNYEGGMDTCTHKRAQGSPDFFVPE